MYKGVLNVLFT
jgi:hypothetical protein